MFGKKYESKPIEKIQDPNTGEIVNRVSIEPALAKSIQDEIQKHSQIMQNFIGNSQNFFLIMKAQLELLAKIDLADKSIKETMNKVMKKSGLDMKQAWAWNLQLGCFEHRTPPIVQGMSAEEIKNSNNPGIPPTIIKQVGVKG